jgi:hypothetical protein
MRPARGLIREHGTNCFEIFFGVVLSADVLFLHRLADHDDPAPAETKDQQGRNRRSDWSYPLMMDHPSSLVRVDSPSDFVSNG